MASASITGAPSKSTRLKHNPVLAAAGLKVKVTFLPVCNQLLLK
ncbi:hypothetical protein JCM19300_36 [Algibacter lectus]|uniref:Uncharacterized protein n=1 Tax=Algibacter lectus TaxID=221126 RepID=A0A090VJX5_9FLAO|nr:hypothetical protein JCM19300_36 [Algibacter lectus]